MKTHNYNIDLMVPGQADKEVLFNQAILKLDCLANLTVLKFIDVIPTNLRAGEKYILGGNDKYGHICYCAGITNAIETLAPQAGMICFVMEENYFYLYENNKWNKLMMGGGALAAAATENSASASLVDLVASTEKFKSIKDKFEIPPKAKHLYLYLDDDCELNFEKVQTREFTFIIKQNWQKTFNFTWPHNVLWPNKQPHKITMTSNAIDIIRLYRLIETQHFIAEIVGQDYRF